MEAFKKSDSKGVVSALATAIRLDHQIAKVPEILFPVIEKRMKSHSDELETITCFIHINRNRNNMIYLDAINEYWPKFPQDKYLLEQRITSFIVSKQLDAALKVVNKALEVYPTSLRFLYCRVIVLCNQDKQQEESLKALEKFINSAPKDHDKVPACYYRKAIYYNHLNNIPKFIEAYKAGLAAEKKQLPCFLPYDFYDKVYLEKLYEYYKSQKDTTSKTKPSTATPSTSSNQSLEKIKLNPQRKFLIIKHRENFISTEEIRNMEGKHKFDLTISKTPNAPKPPRLVSLKNITLKEMNPIEDKPYDGYVLEAQIIEWSFVMTGIATVIEDENGDFQRLSIYNWPTRGNKILDCIEAIKIFRPNSIVSIVNPYMRMSRDGQSLIRVESPGHIQIDSTSADKKCYCCGKEAKILPCSKCLMSHYCSKECQIYDWKEFNHKDLCPYLKKYHDLINLPL